MKKFPYRDLDYYGSKVKELGSGTFGQVQLYKQDQKKYAIKWQNYDYSALHEISTLRISKHPNVIKIIDLLFDFSPPSQELAELEQNPEEELEQDLEAILKEESKDNLQKFLQEKSKKSENHEEGKVRIGIVMKYAKYGSLADLRSFPSDKIKIIYQILCGIAYLHANDIQHRDLKPHNLLFFSNGRIKIIDFGSSEVLRNTKAPDDPEVASLWYRAPEKLLGGRYTLESDLWSIGCIIYWILTKEIFLRGKNEMELIHLIAKKFGIPTEMTWPGCTALPNYHVFKDLDCPGDRHLFSSLKSEERKILTDLLVYSPEKRKSASEILLNKIFDGYRNPKLEISRRSQIKILDRKRPSFNLKDFDPSEDKIIFVLKNWLYRIVNFFDLQQVTFSYTVQLIDIYISLHLDPLDIDEYTVIGIISMIIATEMRENLPLTINEVAKIFQCLDKAEILSQVRDQLLKDLDFNLIMSLPHDYIQLYASLYSSRVIILAYNLEMLLILLPYKYRQDPKILGFLAINIACMFFEEKVHPATDLNNDQLQLMTILLDNSYHLESLCPYIFAEFEKNCQINPHKLLSHALKKPLLR